MWPFSKKWGAPTPQLVMVVSLTNQELPALVRACSGFVHRPSLFRSLMTRDQIQTAINEGIPFEIKMADGARYKVQERYQVAVGRTSVVVFDHKDLAHILPMLTMTGITYLKRDGKR